MAVRQAGRWISQLYDRHLSEAGLGTGQFGLLARLSKMGPTAIAELADAMVMDRTTLTRAVAPMQRDGFLEVSAAEEDRRRKIVHITPKGREALAAARPHWRRAQAEFESHFGAEKAAAMRALLMEVPG